jgi:hypothetical protein
MSDDVARRRWWPVFVSSAALLLLTALLVMLWPSPAVPAPAGFDQIRDSMTENEVEALLGGPRGVYDQSRWLSATTAEYTGPGRGHLSWWYFPDCVVEVVFDEAGRVKGKRLLPPQGDFDRAVSLCKQALR